MDRNKKVSLIKDFNKLVRDCTAIVSEMDTSGEISRIKTRMMAATMINETIFLDKTSVFFEKFRPFINDDNAVLLDVMNNHFPQEDINNINDIQDGEKEMFIDLFKKLATISTPEQRQIIKNMIKQMLQLHDTYTLLC